MPAEVLARMRKQRWALFELLREESGAELPERLLAAPAVRIKLLS